VSTIFGKNGEWGKYSTRDSDEEYIAICIPAFSPYLVYRDEELK
jgi:hypothetical protein